MTREQKVAENYVERLQFDPGYVNGFVDGAKWQKTAAQKAVRFALHNKQSMPLHDCFTCQDTNCKDHGKTDRRCCFEGEESAPSASINNDYAVALYKWRDANIDKLSIPTWSEFNAIVERLNASMHCA